MISSLSAFFRSFGKICLWQDSLQSGDNSGVEVDNNLDTLEHCGILSDWRQLYISR
jgi:hypothetical protein